MSVNGIISRATRNRFRVILEDGRESEAILRGKVVHKKSLKVGDRVRVEFDPSNSERMIISGQLPRHSALIRGRGYKTHTIVANPDQLLILLSAKQPQFRHALMDRYLVVAERNNLPAIIIINKTDLADADDFSEIQHYYTAIGYPVILTSVPLRRGLEQLQAVLVNKTSVLLGHSGVGKSSLVRALQPDLDIHVQSVSGSTNKGKHTTTHAALYRLDIGGFIIDTPGIKELGVGDILKKELKHYFHEFAEFEDDCRFADCTHMDEPGCGVRAEVESGRIPANRYNSYRHIYTELPAHEYEWEQGKIPPV